jgi:methylenetetrahydrofolate dehydrogenase (NADP+)/methenyltetrahydrofolate cyclohydrolase
MVVGSINSSTSRRDLEVVVVGRSELVGRPLAYYLKTKISKVEMIGSKDNITQELINADIIVSATGQANLITGEMVKEGVIVIDVGEPRGDVEFASVAKKASFITPVPGGVGPVTVVSLLENLVEMI